MFQGTIVSVTEVFLIHHATDLAFPFLRHGFLYFLPLSAALGRKSEKPSLYLVRQEGVYVWLPYGKSSGRIQFSFPLCFVVVRWSTAAPSLTPAGKESNLGLTLITGHLPLTEPATVARGLEHVTWLVLDNVPGPGA